MNDIERKGAEAERLLAEIAPYCEQVEKDAYEALLLEIDHDKIIEGQRFILASRKFKATLQTAINLGKQAAKKARAVA